MTTRRGGIAGLCLLLVLGVQASGFAGWNTQLYGPHAFVAAGDTTDVPESSGIVPSRAIPDIFWTHNDSGNSARIWAFRLNAADRIAGVAKKVAGIQLTGGTNVDWEDIATGPGDTIYVFEGGDNPPCDRTNKCIYRIDEPGIDPNGSPVLLSITPAVVRFEYPDSVNSALPADSNAERYDAETLFVHPATGDIYVVTKRTDANVPTARVYKLPAASFTWNSATIYVLQFVANISGNFPITATATGGDVDAWGQRVLVRTYGSAYEFTLPVGAPFDNVFSQTPRMITLSGELQGEGVCYSRDGGDIVSTSEVLGTGPQTCPFYVTPWQLANVRTSGIGATQATLRWDTAIALGSIVHYGLTTAYGGSASDSSPVVSHEIHLAGLQSQSTYFYRVTSGTLIWPQQAPQTVSFSTVSFAPADFDHDDDVDAGDVEHIRSCLTGANLGPPIASCTDCDLDGDADVDLSDFSKVQNCLSGSGIPPGSSCTP